MTKLLNGTRKAYTLFVVLLPLISVYASEIPGFTLGDIILFLFFIYRLITVIKKGTLSISTKMKPIFLLVLTIPIISIVSMLGQNDVDVYSITIRIVRRVFYYLCVIFISGEWFDVDYAKHVIIIVGKFGAIYLFMQYIAYYTGHIILHGYLPFLPLYHESYAQLDYESLYQNMFRPTSFLLEPASFARFACIPLVFLIYDSEKKQKLNWAAILSIAIIASTSGIGTICVAVIWGIYFILNLKNAIETKKIEIKYLFAFLLIIIALQILYSSDIFQLTINRILNTDITDTNTAGGARFRGYLQYLQLPIFNLLLGMGYGSTPNTNLVTWFSGASYILYGCGVFGFLVCIYMFIKLYWDSFFISQKVLCIVFFLLFFMDDCFMSHVAVVFLSFICIESKGKKIS